VETSVVPSREGHAIKAMPIVRSQIDHATIGRNAFVGVVASPKVTIEDGGRMLPARLMRR
jgi:hypothetical protein